MPLNVELLEDQTVCLRGDGVLTFDDAILALRTMSNDSRFDIGTRYLLELRQMESLDLDASGFWKVLSEKQEIKRLFEGTRVAVVPPPAFPTGTIQMYEQLATRLPFVFEVFPEIEAARRWLGTGNTRNPLD